MKKIAVPLIAIALLLGLGYFGFQKYGVNSRVNSLIDTEAEALEFGQRNADVIKFISVYSLRGMKIETYVKWEEKDKKWIFVAYAVNAKDLWYQLDFLPDGTILRSSDGEGG